MSSQLAAENEGVLETLKQTGTKKVALEQLLSIILNRQISRKEAKIFLTDRFGNDKVEWLQMTHDQIYELALAAKKYKLDNQQRWRQQELARQREEQQRQLLRKEQERLRLEMIRKNMTRQAMIKMVQQSIDRCEKIMLTCEDESEYGKLKRSVEDLRRELFILQGKFFEEMNVKQLSEPDEGLDAQTLNRIKAIKDKKIQQIEHARQLQLKEQKMRAEAIRKRLLSVRNRSNIVFSYYARDVATVYSQTFEDRHHNSQTMDLTCFLKFVRDFQLLSKRVDVYWVSSIFKKAAANGLWINSDQFYDLLVSIYNKEHVSEKGKQLAYSDTGFIEYVNNSTLNRERITEKFHLLEKKPHMHHQFEFYTHSGLTKEDVMEEVKRRRALLQERKRSTHNPKRQSISFPLLPHHARGTSSTELKSPIVRSPIKSPLRRSLASVTPLRVLEETPSEDHPRIKSIHDQLKQLQDRKVQQQLRKLIDLKNVEQDEFLRQLRQGKKKSIL